MSIEIRAAIKTKTARRERTLLAFAAAVLVVGATTLSLTTAVSALRWMAVGLAFSVAFGGAHVLLSRSLPQRDPFLLPTAAMLTNLGLLLIGRVAVNFLLRQAIWLLIASGALIAITQLGETLRWLRRFRYTWLLAGLILLALTLAFGVNPSGYGPRLWLGAFGVYVQPSEPLKLLLVIYLASYLAERKELLVSEHAKVGRWRLPSLAYVGPLFAMLGLALVLVAWQQDLGAAMLFFFTFLAMLYLATNQWVYVVVGLILFATIGAVGYTLSSKVALRIDGWLNPWPEAAGRAYQIIQSLIALGTGGVLGRGLGLGAPIYIPAVHTDFIFAAITEELGLVGAVATVALFAILLLRGMRIATQARHPFDHFLAAGVTVALVIQAWIISAGNVKLAPIAGVTLPFVSYGGSSLLVSFVALGLLLRVSSRAAQDQQWRPARTILNHRPSDRSSLRALTVGLTAALVVLAAASGYWALVRATDLRAREDNPRRVLYEQRIPRGRILDRRGVVLADIEMATNGTIERRYPVLEAAPVVGYASLRYGTGGIEAAFDAYLRGEAGRSTWQAAWDDILHRVPAGDDLHLTLDAELQVVAQEALASHQGAAVVIDAQSGDILAMASSPTFNPAELDQAWDTLRESPDAPLINRATQGLYQPGAVLQTPLLATAIDAFWQPAPNATAPIAVNGAQATCARPLSDTITLADAYAAACPAPFAALGEELGASALGETFDRWRLTSPPPLEIPTEFATWSTTAVTTTSALRREAIGQGDLTLTPLQASLIAATLANEGTMPHPTLVRRLEGRTAPTEEALGEILTPREANAILDEWTQRGSILTHWGTAIAGQEQRLHAWLLGIAPAGDPRYAAAILIEHAPSPEAIVALGTTLLDHALAMP